MLKETHQSSQTKLKKWEWIRLLIKIIEEINNSKFSVSDDVNELIEWRIPKKYLKILKEFNIENVDLNWESICIDWVNTPLEVALQLYFSYLSWQKWSELNRSRFLSLDEKNDKISDIRKQALEKNIDSTDLNKIKNEELTKILTSNDLVVKNLIKLYQYSRSKVDQEWNQENDSTEIEWQEQTWEIEIKKQDNNIFDMLAERELLYMVCLSETRVENAKKLIPELVKRPELFLKLVVNKKLWLLLDYDEYTESSLYLMKYKNWNVYLLELICNDENLINFLRLKGWAVINWLIQIFSINFNETSLLSYAIDMGINLFEMCSDEKKIDILLSLNKKSNLGFSALNFINNDKEKLEVLINSHEKYLDFCRDFYNNLEVLEGIEV